MANIPVLANIYGAIVDQRDESTAEFTKGSIRVTWEEGDFDRITYFEYWDIVSYKDALKDSLKFFAKVI